MQIRPSAVSGLQICALSKNILSRVFFRSANIFHMLFAIHNEETEDFFLVH